MAQWVCILLILAEDWSWHPALTWWFTAPASGEPMLSSPIVLGTSIMEYMLAAKTLHIK